MQEGERKRTWAQLSSQTRTKRFSENKAPVCGSKYEIEGKSQCFSGGHPGAAHGVVLFSSLLFRTKGKSPQVNSELRLPFHSIRL